MTSALCRIIVGVMAKRARGRTKAEMAADKLRTGRPPGDPSERQSERVMVYLTPAERKRLGALAKAEGISLAALVMRPWREKEE